MKHDERPYFFIALFCFAIGIVRYYILEGWSLWWHIFTFFIQFLFIVGIWQLVRIINSKLELRFSFGRQAVTRILLQVFITLVLISPVFVISYLIARPYIPSDLDNKHLIMLAVIMFVTLLLMIFAFYAYDFSSKLRVSIEEKSKLEIATARLNEEKSLMQYHHLRNQVNPHFLFNTLTSLDGLIHSNPDLASDFVQHLSKVYRYVLEHKENEVVSLETEANFIQHYISLLKIRYSNALQINMNISPVAMEKGIVMVTLQMLIDNAIKHNQVDPAKPLTIEIRDEDNLLHVRNNKQLRKQIDNSTKKGLQQLKQLYGFLTKHPVTVADSNDFFDIKIPLL